MFLDIKQKDKIAELLKKGKIGVLPTDTIYGLHCLADNNSLSKKINILKGREEDTPLITLISNISELEDFELVLSDFVNEQIQKLWPGPNTLIFDTSNGESKAFRLPDNKFLIEVLSITGPLVSTSANKHGEPFALEINQAKKSFQNDVDFYVDVGVLKSSASNMYKINESNIEKIR